MVYTPQNWATGSSGGTPLSAARLNVIEQGIVDAHALAGGAAAGMGGIYIDSYAGSDDARLTAAIAAATAQDYPAPILLGSRAYTFSEARNLYDGFALIGSEGMGNAELSNKGTNKTRVNVNTSGVWLSASGSVRSSSQNWDNTFRNISFNGSSATQWMGGSAVIWCMNLRDCAWSGFKTILGSQAKKLLLNLCLFDGWLSLNNCYNGAVHIGGSDNSLFMGMTNIDSGTPFCSAGGSKGQYHLWFDYMTKTYIGPIYLTAEGGWNGIRVDGAAEPWNTVNGNTGGPLTFSGMRLEGRNTGAPCHGALFRQTGGIVVLDKSWVGYGMASPASVGHSPADAGVIHQVGGVLDVDKCTYDKTASIAHTVPFVYSASGVCRVSRINRSAGGGAWGSSLPKVVALGQGTTDNSVTKV